MSALSIAIRRKLFDGREVLGDLQFSVADGEFVALLGPSGCGKSTLLNMIGGLDADYEGQIEHDSDGRVEGKGEGGGRLGFMFQEPRLMPWLSARDNVSLVCDDPRGAAAAAEARLAEVGLGERAGAWPQQLSGGQQRRVALARAFITRPRLLLMDEPFISLDAPTAAALQEQLLALWREHAPAVLYVTHDLREALALADRVLFLCDAPARLVLDYRLPLPRAERGDPDGRALGELRAALLARYPHLLSGRLD